MSKIFNRKDSTVIATALQLSKEEFVVAYTDTTASQATLEKAYDEINGNKTKSTIAVQSGDGNPTEPLTPIEPLTLKTYSLDKDGEIEVPKSLKFKGGKMTEATPNPDAMLSSSDKPKAAKEKAPKEKKEKAVKTPSTQGPSKRDIIRELIDANTAITNKEIKAALLEKGFNSCYDSEISAVRKK
jgi:hypothetical protein